MKRSIFFYITLIFLIAFFSISFSFYLFLKYENEKSNFQIKNRFALISKTLTWKLQNIQNIKRLEKDLSEIDLILIDFPKEAIKIVKNSQKIEKISTLFGDFYLLKYNGDYYIFIQTFGNFLLLKDISRSKNIFIYPIFLITLLILLLAYIGIVLKLKPLKKIQKEIKKLSKGDLNLDLDIKGSSEITEVAKALKESIEAIKNILNSRKLLLRNIMHELKTPITKGRIVAEMIEDENKKIKLIKIFEKLNSLINEIAALERINSKIKPNLEMKKIEEIIDESIKLGMFDKKNILIKYLDKPKINVDYKLFSIAVKNLIENAIAHSTDSKAKIYVYKNKIEFLNIGSPLKNDLSYYIEPFSKDKKSKGFGLGLYLVNSILKLHNFKLEYQYNNSLNIFTIYF